jgi:hypothetical protein
MFPRAVVEPQDIDRVVDVSIVDFIRLGDSLADEGVWRSVHGAIMPAVRMPLVRYRDRS